MSVFAHIDACRNDDELKKVLENHVVYCKNQLEVSLKTNYGEMGKKLASLVVEKSSFFANDVHQKYAEVAHIYGKEVQQSTNVSSYSNASTGMESTNFDSMMQSLMHKFSSEEDENFGKGVGVGVALAVLVPGVGWLLGGAIALFSGFLGTLFGPDLDEKKQRAKEELYSTNDSVWKNIVDNLVNTFSSMANHCGEQLEKNLNAQASQYFEAIDALNQHIEDDVHRIAVARSGLDECRRDLARVREAVDDIGREAGSGMM